MINRASNARYLGPIVFGELSTATEDQYQPTRPMYVEVGGYTKKEQDCKGCMGPCGQCDEQEPDPEELPDQDWANQPKEYDPS